MHLDTPPSPKVQDAVVDLMTLCLKPTLRPRPLFSREELTDSQILQIERDVAMEPLPPDWLFDGSQYINFTGTRSQRRPDLEEQVGEWLRCQNAEREEWNTDLWPVHGPV